MPDIQKVFHMKKKGLTDFIPIEVGTSKCTPDSYWGPYIRKHYLIHYVVKGKGFFKNQDHEYTVSAGQAFLIRPYEITLYFADAIDPWEYVWISFTGEYASKFDFVDDVFDIDENIFLDVLNMNKYGNSMEEYIACILFKIYSEININTSSGTADYVSQVMHHINTNYMRDIKIAEVAKLFKISHKYLVRIFKEKTGMTVQEYLINRRLHEAKSLLKKGFYVSETAQMVGYNDYFSFSKAFKKRYGIPPSEFKENKAISTDNNHHELYNKITSQ